MSKSFTRKKINVTFLLGEGQFGETGADTVKYEGLRTRVDIAQAGGNFKGALNLQLYGLNLSEVSQLAKVGRSPVSVRSNAVIVEAGDDEIGMSNIYEGTIHEAWADYNNAPDCSFTVAAMAGFFQSVRPAPPSSYQGTVDAAVVMNNIASAMKLTFVNNGVSVILTDPVFPGSLWDQALSCSIQGNFCWTIDRNIFAIWPIGGSRNGPNEVIPIISPDSGMVGYPRFNANGISIVTLFDPRITLGGQVKVESALEQACGIWRVGMLAHNLESEQPNGAWFTTMDCHYVNKITVNSR